MGETCTVENAGQDSVSNGLRKKVLGKLEIRFESAEMNGDKPVLLMSIYTEKGDYIGGPDSIMSFLNKYMIIPEVYGDNNVCSIGKSLEDGKWYGWSHRATGCFQIGDTVKEGDCTASSGWTDEYLEDHDDPYVLPVGFEAKTEDDCKRMAIAFAHSVS